MDIKKVLLSTIKNKEIQNFEQQLEACRPKLIKYLSENSLNILKEKITEVYSINNWRHQIIPLELFLEAVKITNIKEWSFDIIVDEKVLNYVTSDGQPVYQGYYEGIYDNTYGKRVTNLREYWHTPINNISENIYYINGAIKEIVEFIKNDFVIYAKKILGGK